MEENTSAIVEINKAEQALERAADIHEMLELRDKAAALKVFADAQGFKEAAQKAKIFQLKAERKAGDWLRENVSAGNPQLSQDATISQLPDGIDRWESSRWQLEAEVPEEKFHEWVDDCLSTGKEISAAGLQRLARVEQAQEKIQEILNSPTSELCGLYDVIVIDPPWHMEKIEREVAPNQVVFDYPTMQLNEIAQIEIPAADDCHIFLWTTQKHLPSAFVLLDTWGFNYVCTFVWHKPGGFQPFGLPQYNCEFVLYARLGSPQFIDFKQFFTCFNAPRNGHSAKPEEFYETIRRVTAGRRLDMFGRRKIEGFESWGNEV